MKRSACIKLIALALAGLLVALAAGGVAAATTTYTDRATFENQLGTTIIDDYSNSGYGFLNSAATMSSVLGETDYASTQHNPPDNNLVFSTGAARSYCAGCNGSFLLSFTTTSVGDSSGVFGVGFDFFNQFAPLYHAFITFSDGSTQDVALPQGLFSTSGLPGFFGVTSDKKIKSIHMGLANGGKTSGGSFGIDNLTIGGVGVITFEIDIKPGSDPSAFGCGSKGSIPVAILSDPTHDATDVDADTVLFGLNGNETGEVHVNKKTGNVRRHVEDVNGDGLDDLVFHFDFTQTGFECDDPPHRLTGKLTGNLIASAGGSAIEGESDILLVGKK